MPTRREEIVAIARATFAERGYTNTTMRDIAESADLMAGSLYSHFKSKAEILKLVLEPLLDKLLPVQEAALDSDASGLDKLETMMRGALGVIAECDEELTILHYDWADLAQLDDIDDIVARSNRLLELWHAAITEGMKDGSIRSDLEPELIIRMITSSLHAIVDRKRYGARPAPLSIARLDSLAEQLVTLFVSGLRADTRTTRRSRKRS